VVRVLIVSSAPNLLALGSPDPLAGCFPGIGSVGGGRTFRFSALIAATVPLVAFICRGTNVVVDGDVGRAAVSRTRLGPRHRWPVRRRRRRPWSRNTRRWNGRSGCGGRVFFGVSLWFGGARLLLLIGFRRRRHVSADPGLRRCVEQLTARLGLRRGIRVEEIQGLVSPIAYGIFRPAVGCHPGFPSEFGDTQRQAMLAHELGAFGGARSILAGRRRM
jgi:hypothetical protein